MKNQNATITMTTKLVLAAFAVVSLARCSGFTSASSSGLSTGLSMSGTCDDRIFEQYQTTVYPFFRSEATCIHCHIEGGQGLGTFASSDPKSAFAAFSAAGVSKIAYMATNAQHKPPYTGDQNRAAVTAWSTAWNKDQADYLDCVSKSQNGGVNESLLTAPKSAPGIYASETASQTLTWELDLAQDLDPSVTRAIPARISIDVRVLYQAGKVQGYVFSNPSMQLKDTTQQIVIEGLFFQINQLPIPSQTTFTSLSRVVSGAAAVPLMNAQANTLIQPVSSQDTFQLYLQRIAKASGSSDAPHPLTPILTVSDSTTGSTTLLKSAQSSVNIMRDAGIARWCLTETAAKPASADAPCVGAVAGGMNNGMNGWQPARPMTFNFSPGDGAKRLYLWVADLNLNLNDQAAVVDVILDTTAPAAPTIASITFTDTQVASMSVTHPLESDVTGWCVIEQNSIKAAPKSIGLADACWQWADDHAKPTTVGFKDGGSRDVWVFARDKAGNVSAPSNKVTVVNTFGAVTFSQLTASSGGPRGALYANCYTCHGNAGNPGFNKLALFDFTEAVKAAQSDVLVSRINNAVSPMPNINGGLMPQRARDLIRLWTLPEEGNQPLP